ncbi:hypothetical protein CCMSSC00406_0010143 [Pleurotus cornucopiae]|uniref:Uncharacterized protein n=1 Tax=Pleurotus cornucopiae TaxID=5321 RepID=A0ACB7IT72_PLECO|nr:hypothetical protein CCMSSC00406_0010143 [Pleurotus cornucopiae]
MARSTETNADANALTALFGAMTVSPRRNYALVRALRALADALDDTPVAALVPANAPAGVNQSSTGTAAAGGAPPSSTNVGAGSSSPASPAQPGVQYHVPSAAEHARGGQLYVVTRGLNIGIFYGWENVAPLVTGVSRAVYFTIDDVQEGHQRMLNAINNQSASRVAPAP